MFRKKLSEIIQKLIKCMFGKKLERIRIIGFRNENKIYFL